jgi:hypothetical protein
LMSVQHCTLVNLVHSGSETESCLPELAIEGGVCMTQTKTSVSHRVLLVDDDEAVRSMMTATPKLYLHRELRRAHHRPAHAEPG